MTIRFWFNGRAYLSKRGDLPRLRVSRRARWTPKKAFWYALIDLRSRRSW